MSSKRQDWTFGYTGEELHEACAQEIERRRDRIRFWQDQARIAKDAITAGGLSTRTFDITGGQRSEVVVDPELSKRLSEAESKVRSHHATIFELVCWAGLFGRAREGKFQATFEDAKYFGLHRSLDEELSES